MLRRGANRFAVFGGNFVNGLRPHLPDGEHFAPDKFSRLFIKRQHLIAFFNIFNHHLVVEVLFVFPIRN